MQSLLQIQLREIKDDGLTIASTQKIFLDKNANYDHFLKQITSKQKLKHLLEQDYIVYLPQGVQINEDNFKHIVGHLWKIWQIKKQPMLNIQKVTTNKEWNIEDIMKQEGGTFPEKTQKVPFKQQSKKKKSDATKISFSGSACDKQFKLSNSDLPLLEKLNILKPTQNEATIIPISFSQLKDKVRAAVKAKQWQM